MCPGSKRHSAPTVGQARPGHSLGFLQPPGEGSCSGRGHTGAARELGLSLPACMSWPGYPHAELRCALATRGCSGTRASFTEQERQPDPLTSTPSRQTFLRDPSGGKASQAAPAGSRASPGFFISGQGSSGDDAGCISQHAASLGDTPET